MNNIVLEIYNDITTSVDNSADVVIKSELIKEKQISLNYLRNQLIEHLYSDKRIIEPDKKGWGYHIKNKNKFKQYKSAIAEYINNIT